jgi:ATP-dependent Clp protease ATP-binding subunit ClpC
MLTEKIRRNPYRVVLFDEIEKAHYDVFNILLQVLEEGELRDSLGHTVSFRNTIIIMTSNAGAREISKDNRLGFSSGPSNLSAAEIETQAMSEMKRIFSPEFINRVDEIVVFNPLEQKQINAIFDIEIEELSRRLEEQNYTLKVSGAAKRVLVEMGWDQKFGGRHLRRTIQKELESPLSDLILEDCWEEGAVFTVDAKKGEIRIKGKNPSTIDSLSPVETA